MHSVRLAGWLVGYLLASILEWNLLVSRCIHSLRCCSKFLWISFVAAVETDFNPAEKIYGEVFSRLCESEKRNGIETLRYTQIVKYIRIYIWRWLKSIWYTHMDAFVFSTCTAFLIEHCDFSTFPHRPIELPNLSFILRTLPLWIAILMPKWQILVSS